MRNRSKARRQKAGARFSHTARSNFLESVTFSAFRRFPLNAAGSDGSPVRARLGRDPRAAAVEESDPAVAKRGEAWHRVIRAGVAQW